MRSMSVELPITTPVAFACPRRFRPADGGLRERENTVYFFERVP